MFSASDEPGQGVKPSNRESVLSRCAPERWQADAKANGVCQLRLECGRVVTISEDKARIDEMVAAASR